MSPEKVEEEKLFSKFPQAKAGMPPSQFLQKRLQQRKYFDSGDYNMAKAKGLKLGALARPPPAQKKPVLAVVVDDGGQTSPTGNRIPTPETVPTRKTSIVNPAASNLSPQPIHHHPEQSLIEEAS